MNFFCGDLWLYGIDVVDRGWFWGCCICDELGGIGDWVDNMFCWGFVVVGVFGFGVVVGMWIGGYVVVCGWCG